MQDTGRKTEPSEVNLEQVVQYDPELKEENIAEAEPVVLPDPQPNATKTGKRYPEIARVKPTRFTINLSHEY